MADVDVLIVGPVTGSGGITKYIADQRRHLPDGYSVREFDTATPDATGIFGLLLGALTVVSGWIRFPWCRRPDLVHLHTSHYLSFYISAPYVFVASWAWDVPVVVHVHGSSFDEFVEAASVPVGALQSVVFHASDAVIVLSEYWRDVLATRASDETLVVVPNAVDPDRYDPEWGTDPQHLVYISAHIERKGIGETIAALERLDDRGIEFEATIGGDGPLSARADELAARTETVDYVGYVSEADKRAILDAGSIYVLPTRAEGLPIAILEAMAGGNAIVSTDVGSIPSVVDESTGELVAPGDVDDLVDTLEYLVTHPDATARRGTESRRRVKRDYNWDDIARELDWLYTQLLAEAGHPAGETPAQPVSAVRRPPRHADAE